MGPAWRTPTSLRLQHIAEVGWEDQDSLSLGHYRALSEALDLPWHYLQLQAHQFSRIDASELQARLRGIVQAQSGRESGLPPGY